jgi:hypothetical protein
MKSFGAGFFAWLGEGLGRILGVLLAPLFALWAAGKRARPFHADGIEVRIQVSPASASSSEPVRRLGQRLTGPGMARFSLAITDRQQREANTGRVSPDVFGLGLVLGKPESRQHLLLATFDSFGTVRKALRETRSDDFLANNYRGVGLYWLDNFGPVRLRIRPLDQERTPGTRETRLAATIEMKARLILELSRTDRPSDWQSVAEIHLDCPLETATPALSPFQDGAGLRPIGVTAGIRRVVYPVSRWARRARLS